MAIYIKGFVMTKKFFITGTDTDAGKTFVSCCFERFLMANGYKVVPYKPIVAGLDSDGKNLDLESHVKATRLNIDPRKISSCIYEKPIAPHIAALENKDLITFDRLDKGLDSALSQKPDCVVVEGAGGWLLPIGEGRVLPDWPVMQDMTVIIVVGLKLGCLNHALLTRDSVRAKGFKLGGYIVNQVTKDPMPYMNENIDTLQQMMDIPYLGMVPYTTNNDFELAQPKFNKDKILSLL